MQEESSSVVVSPSSSLTDDPMELFVIKRDQSVEAMSFDKIQHRIRKLAKEGDLAHVNVSALAMKVIEQLHNRITTRQIDELAAEQCAVMSAQHMDYGALAGRIVISNNHKNTNASFAETMRVLWQFRDCHDVHRPLISNELIAFVESNAAALDAMIDHQRDYLIDYFGFRTLERSYLTHIHGVIVERPQYMWMRVAVGIHATLPWDGEDVLANIRETYDCLSLKQYTHATPTLFNAGTPSPQLSSCFLLGIEEDSLDGIFNTLKKCAMLSKFSGGIGLHIHNVRAKNSHIQGTNGKSTGLIPMLRVFNDTARYVDQCVPGDTLLYTEEGLRRIDQCMAGHTRILNSEGRWETIQRVLEHSYHGDMLQITFAHKQLPPLHITPLHPILVYNQLTQTVTFEEAERLDPRVHSLAQPVLTEDPVSELSKHWTEEDAFLYGWMLVYGGVQGSMYTLTMPANVSSAIKQRVREYLQGRCVQLTSVRDDETGVEHWCWSATLLLPIRAATMTNAVDPTLWTASKQVLREWLRGVYGCPVYTEDKQQVGASCLPTSLFMTNSEAVAILEYAWLRLGVAMPLDVAASDSNTIGWMPLVGDVHAVVANSSMSAVTDVVIANDKPYVLRPIVQIERTTGHECLLYDLQMQWVHDYNLRQGVVHNGGGKRQGSFAVYLEPWHPDVEMFLDLRKNRGEEELRARDLFYALWIPDLFMERLVEEKQWSLFCPHECPGLSDVHGDAFKALYERYEAEGRARKTMSARDLWFQILDAQMESGAPFLLYKDAANAKSNQQHLGTIKSSNLCCEIIEYSDGKEQTAVCNLASISLSSIVDTATRTIRYDLLHRLTRVITRNLNKIIDLNYYPLPCTERSNRRHRPIGIGVQGLADLFFLMKWSFDSAEAREANRLIFETMYHAALTESCALAKKQGAYESFAGSPASQGRLQFDLWNTGPASDRYDWAQLKRDIQTYGLRNSLLIALMPTASTAQILGNNECFEPITTNLYSRRTAAGEFVVVNKYLMRELMEMHCWNDAVKNSIIAHRGSVQQLTQLPAEMRHRYRTVWEMSPKSILEMAADRGPFVCHSQSMNLWVSDPNYNILTKMQVFAWKRGLKTGLYYLRRRAAHQAQQFTIEPETNTQHQQQPPEPPAQEEENEPCLMCSA